MPRKPVPDRACSNPDCTLHAQFGKGNIVRHSFVRPKRGRRRRCRCEACGEALCSPYYWLRHAMATFDEVAVFVPVVIRLLHRCGQTGSGRTVA